MGRLAATVDRLSREVRAAQAEAEGRALIELAKGILVERLGCGPSQAARQLAELTEQAGRPAGVRVEVINQAARDRMSEVTNAFLAATRAAEEAGRDPRRRTAARGRERALAADDTQAVAESLLAQALRPAGGGGRGDLGGRRRRVAHPGGQRRVLPRGGGALVLRAAGRGDGRPVRPRGARRPVDHVAGRPGLPSVGRHHHPDGGRAAVPAGTGGRVYGVLEIVWPDPLPEQPPQIVRQVEALAELCAHTLETYTAPDGPAPQPRVLPDAAELMDLADGLYDPALVLVPHLDDQGNLLDFRIQHVNSRFLDPAGRPRAMVSGSLLLEAYPMAAGNSELFQRIERVYATGEPFRARRMNLTALVDQVPAVVGRRHQCQPARLRHPVHLADRGRDGPPGEPAPARPAARPDRRFRGEPADRGDHLERTALRPVRTSRVQPAGAAAGAARRTPTRRRRHHRPLPAHAAAPPAPGVGRLPAATAGRGDPAHPGRRRAVLDTDGRLLTTRGAYQDISAQHWTEVALAATRDQLAHTEQHASERDRLALQLQRAIMPPTQAPLQVPDLDVAVR
ncbi:hypothetical protein GCM10023238_37370 [Streptomyces heliomycini]